MVYGTTVTVAAAGKRVRLASVRTMADWVQLQANGSTPGGQTANTGAIATGDKNVTMANGIILLPGDGFLYPMVSGATMYDLHEMYLDAETDGDGARVLYGRK